MTKAQADKIMEILDKNCIDYKVYEDYSGRYMYGRTTTGVVTKMCPIDFEYTLKEEFIEILLDEGEINEGDLEGGGYDSQWLDETIKKHKLYPSYRCDNMAMDMIYY